jgi:transcriptional regulator with XRE-family HTH domain
MSLSLEEAFGQILKELRKEKGLSQEELAHKSGLDRTFISLLERGKRQPSLGTITSIAGVLELPASDFVKKVEIALKAS